MLSDTERRPRDAGRARSVTRWPVSLVVFLGLMMATTALVPAANAAAPGVTITSPVIIGDVGRVSHLRLDGDLPIISYLDQSSGPFRTIRCLDPVCLTHEQTDEFVPSRTVRDAQGFLVYSIFSEGSLLVVHCLDSSCTRSSRTFPDPDPLVTGRFGSSLVLDDSGFPVISYYAIANADLRIMHCNDPNCAGGDESITSPDPDGVTGQHSELVLDESGHPVAAYYDTSGSQLAVLRCDDPLCAGDESAVHPDRSGITGRFGKSIVLDDRGNPVISYYDTTNGDLKMLRCDTPDCSGPVTMLGASDYPPTDYPPDDRPPPTTADQPPADPSNPSHSLPVTGRQPMSIIAASLLLFSGSILVLGARRRRTFDR